MNKLKTDYQYHLKPALHLRPDIHKSVKQKFHNSPGNFLRRISWYDSMVRLFKFTDATTATTWIFYDCR